jgi:hypothetical protein
MPIAETTILLTNGCFALSSRFATLVLLHRSPPVMVLVMSLRAIWREAMSPLALLHASLGATTAARTWANFSPYEACGNLPEEWSSRKVVDKPRDERQPCLYRCHQGFKIRPVCELLVVPDPKQLEAGGRSDDRPIHNNRELTHTLVVVHQLSFCNIQRETVSLRVSRKPVCNLLL